MRADATGKGATGEGVRIGTVAVSQLERLLPLIEGYQRFHGVGDIDRGRNRGFYGRLVAPSPHGVLLGAWRGAGPIGFACLHWSLDSVRMRETVTLHDIYVEEADRGAGIGRALITAAMDQGRARGAHALIWANDPGNHTAQRLFDSLGTQTSQHVSYELPL